MLAGTGNCQNHYNPLLSLSSLFNFSSWDSAQYKYPFGCSWCSISDLYFAIIKSSIPPLSAQSCQYNLSQSLQDTWSVHGTLPHSSHKNYHFSFCSCYYKPGISCACRPGLTGWPRPINIPGYLYPTSHLVWQQNRGAWSPPRTRLTIACITSLSPWVHIQNTTEVNGELVNRVVVDQPAATSIWPSIKEAITDYSLAGIVVHPCQLQTSIVFDVVDLYNMYSRIVICDIDW